MAGWVKIYRQIQENAIWMSDEPFDSRSAWIDLILMANHEEKEIYQNGKFFKVKRGQLHRSQLKLAERWHWNKKRVNNFLKELKKVNMIDYKSSNGGTTNGTMITIVNYDAFQVLGSTNGTMNGTTNNPTEGSEVEQRWDNGGDINKNNKELKENKNNREGKSRAFTPPTLEEITSYCLERKNKVNPERFIDFYASKGWMVGKNKMKDWKAAVRTWEQRDEEQPKPTQAKPKTKDYSQRNYTDEEYKELERRALGIT